MATVDAQWLCVCVCVQEMKSYCKYKETIIFIEGCDASSLFPPKEASVYSGIEKTFRH